MDTLKKFFTRALIIIFLLAVGTSLFVVYANYSEGVRAGIVIKKSRKGVLFKTHEGQLNTGGFSEAGGDITSSIWHFSIKPGNTEVMDELERAIDHGKRVKLFYKEKYVRIFFLGDTKYFVYRVEEVE
ncbi:MAG: 6-phosphogluconate dehydrogenase [Flavobacteriales bacterium]|nr:6-phosphogluconate dehydrogenase [Flavobacteriales bacterium]